MKKIKIILTLLLTIFICSKNVYAASGSLSVSSGSVYVGDSFTITASISSAAAWNVHVNSSGPVSGCTINQADATADALDTNKSFSATCTATGTGTITISLSGDVTSAVDGNAVSISGTKTVSVVEKPKPTPTPTPSPNPTPNPKPNNNGGGNSSNNNTPSKSSNNKLKEIGVDGFELVKVDDNNYTLEVKNNVTSINVSASSEDSKAKVEGTGKHELKVGENTIEIVVTAENGSVNKIVIKVTRKDGYYLNDIDEAISDDNSVINLKKDDVINDEIINKIKNSKKEVVFNYYDDSNKLIYSWILDGRKIDNIVKFNHVITFDSDNKDDIYKLVNYSDGLIVNFAHEGVLPKGTKVKVYVGSKYSNDSLVNVYYYNRNDKRIEKIASNVKVSDGYITFDIDHACEYFITLANLDNNGNSGNNMITTAIIIVLSVLFVLAIGYIVYDKVIKKRHI